MLLGEGKVPLAAINVESPPCPGTHSKHLSLNMLIHCVTQQNVLS